MAIRQLTKSEINQLLLTLTLSGYVPGRDFKLDKNGQILAKKELIPTIQRIPVISEIDSRHLYNNQPKPKLSV